MINVYYIVGDYFLKISLNILYFLDMEQEIFIQKSMKNIIPKKGYDKKIPNNLKQLLNSKIDLMITIIINFIICGNSRSEKLFKFYKKNLTKI